ncbi:MAG: hypothetical protein IIX55_01300, partial [Muribaculaceae bacterium]|nr:hypothetical protein [Muribaculaceae bacterium]
PLTYHFYLRLHMRFDPTGLPHYSNTIDRPTTHFLSSTPSKTLYRLSTARQTISSSIGADSDANISTGVVGSELYRNLRQPTRKW